jgi:outer membrane lipoprotein SlyB
MKKFIIILGMSMVLYSCGSMQGNPMAIGIGAETGGMLGSVIGGSMSDDYNGYAIGNVIGTIAGAVIGNAVTSPKVESQSEDNNSNYDNQNSDYAGYDNSYPQPVQRQSGRTYSRQDAPQQQATSLPLYIENIRFVDENKDKAIGAKENCQLIFIFHNTGSTTLYNVYPRIGLSNRNVGASSPLVIDKLNPGERVRYTAWLYGYSALRDGSVDITLTACQQDGGVGDVHQFSIDTTR